MEKINIYCGRIVILLFGFVLFSTNLQSQDSTDFNNIIPPSPSAASLGKFADIPVSLYTGIPQISVPIWNIENKSLNIPISLSYHASGLKVEEVPGWVGMGWALNAGGVITRTMVGKPDEYPSKGYLDIGDDIPNPNSSYYTFLGWEPQWDTLYRVAEAEWEFEPDIFTFNFVGRTGRFVIDPYNSTTSDIEVITIPYSKLRIEATLSGGQITEWEIIDENGIMYVFSDVENTYSYSWEAGGSKSRPNPTFKSSWHLSEITFPNSKDKIKFSYGSMDEEYEITYKQIKYEDDDNCGALGTKRITNRLDIGTLKIESIEFPLGKIEFIEHSGRDDLDNSSGCYLDSVYVYNYLGDTVRIFDLDYTFVTGNSSGLPGEEGYMKKRLRLDSVEELGKDGSKKNPYEFTYITGILPSRHSKAQDYWGFYNGETTNDLLIPGMYHGLDWLPGAIRDPNPDYLKRGTLEKIIYPTGGYTKFEYEAHDYGYIEDDEVTGYYGDKDEHTLDWDDELEFTLDFAQYVDLNLKYNPDTFYADFDPDDNIIYDNNDTYQQQTVFMPAGEYTLSIGKHYQYEGGQAKNQEIDIAFIEDEYEETEYKYAGGLRIKKKIDYDGISPYNNIIKEYTYKCSEVGEENRSSGVLVSDLPIYSYTYKICEFENGQYTGQVCDYFARTSFSQVQLGTTQGSHIGYKEVIVLDGTNGVNGETYDEFTSAFDQPDGNTYSSSVPFPPPTSFDWKRGLLLKEIVYDKDGNALHEQEFEYEFKDELGAIHRTIIPGFKAVYTKVGNGPTAAEDNIHWEAESRPYEVVSEWFYPKKKTSKNFLDSIASPVTIVENFIYNFDYLQLGSKFSTNSSGKTTASHYWYPSSIGYKTTPPYSDMYSNYNIINPVVEIKNSVGGYQISGKKTSYHDFEMQNMFMPNIIYNWESGTTYSKDYTYGAYDTNGNLTQFYKEHNFATSIIWGYEESLPIAIVEHTDSTSELEQAFYTGFEEDENAITSKDNCKAGRKYYELSGNYSVSVTFKGGDYLMDYWWKSSQEGDWEYQVEEKTYTSSDLQTLKSSGYIDELRVYPVNAKMKSFTYDPLVGVTSIEDENGVITYYDYDSFGRLILILDQDKNILKRITYHYKD